jgi:lysophospholipase L1-like esterase
MRKRLTLSLLVAVAFGVLALVVPEAAGATGSPTPPYYLSLGDSLAQGVQPTPSGQSVITDQGYADDLYSVERLQVPGLKLEKLGCPGESTTSMITQTVCDGAYAPFADQLAAAVAFLATHHVVLITIDIGANNVDDCVTPTGISLQCIGAGFAAAQSDLPKILAALRTAAPGVPIVGMNYYDPFLSAWLQGSAGQALATQSLALTLAYNSLLGAVYGGAAVPVADVQSAFQTTVTSTIPVLQIPVNVAAICTLTWMCAPAPVGPNIHARALGYWVIASAFAEKVGRLGGGRF